MTQILQFNLGVDSFCVRYKNPPYAAEDAADFMDGFSSLSRI
jgi:hypothetical protein